MRSTLPYLRVLAVPMRDLVIALMLIAGVAFAVAVGVGVGLLLG